MAKKAFWNCSTDPACFVHNADELTQIRNLIDSPLFPHTDTTLQNAWNLCHVSQGVKVTVLNQTELEIIGFIERGSV